MCIIFICFRLNHVWEVRESVPGHLPLYRVGLPEERDDALHVTLEISVVFRSYFSSFRFLDEISIIDEMFCVLGRVQSGLIMLTSQLSYLAFKHIQRHAHTATSA
jgi:hypothetical protein